MSGATRVANALVTLERRARRQTVFAGGLTQSAADTLSTSDEVNYATAISWIWDELPDGEYLVVVTGSLLAAHSAGGSVGFRVTCAGQNSATHTIGVPNESPATTRLEKTHTLTEVVAANGTGITITGEYRSGSTGTSSTRNPSLAATAILVG